MSKGYYAVMLMVFHSREDRESYLEMNHSCLKIARKEGEDFHSKIVKERETAATFCGSCEQYHLPRRVYKDKNREEIKKLNFK